MKKRRFQADLERIADDVASGRLTSKKTVAAITPGGGKTYGGFLFARKLLDAGHVDYVVWAVPRKTLVNQVASSSAFPGLGRCDNTVPLVKGNPGECGYAVTIQSVAQFPELHTHFAKAHRILLVIDEVHHLPVPNGSNDKETAWTSAFMDVAEHATHVLAMSGTLYRHDKKPIAFVEYAGGEPSCDVAYTRTNALRDGAKVRIVPEWLDAPTEWQLADGTLVGTKISEPDIRVRGSMAWSLAGHEDFYSDAIRKTVNAWRRHRARNHRAQLLVVVRDQAVAKASFDYLKSYAPSCNAGLAISDRAEQAQRDVRRFREAKLDALVTVGMAYEGMDAPRVTHVACLTGFRSVPWVEQCLDRGTRIDWIDKSRRRRNEAKNCCHVFVARDPKMVDALSMIEDEQPGETRAERDERETANSDRTGEPLDLGPELTAVHELELGGIEGVRQRVQAVFPYAEDLPDEAIEMLAGLGVAAAKADPVVMDVVPSTVYDPEEESRLRRTLDRATKQNDRDRGYEWGLTNKKLFRVFGKSRKRLTVYEIRRAIEMVLEGSL